MSALTDRVAREHEFRWVGDELGRGCTCGESFDFVPVDCTASGAYARHIAEVTEAAVRERVAQDIRAQRERYSCTGLEDAAYDDAARIARGGAA